MVVPASLPVGPTLGLEASPEVGELCSEAPEHLFDHVIRPDAKNRISDLGRQVTVPQVPSNAHQLPEIGVPDLDDELRRGLNPDPSPIVELEPVAVGHCHRLREVEKDLLALIGSEAHPAAVTGVEIERERPSGVFRWPVTEQSMNESGKHRRFFQ
jgi:hypothetical protein